MGLNGKALLYAINLVCGLSIFFFGYDQGMMGGVNTAPDYVRTMGLGHTQNAGVVVTATVTNTTKQGGIVSIYYLGTLIGCMLGGWIGDKIGRKKTILVGCGWIFLGAPLQASAQNSTWMLMARLINGVGTGHLNVIVPVWSAETSGHMSRGFFIAMEFTLNIFGVVVAYWLEYGLSFVGNGDTQIRWRFPIAFQLVPLIVLAISVNMMPESPRWLMKNGQSEEALEVLGRLRSNDGVVNKEAEIEHSGIQNALALETKSGFSYLSMLFKSSGKLHMSRRTQLAIWIQILQEWTGIAAITIYQPIIFSQAGFSSSKSGLLSGINTITYMLSTLVCVFTLDKLGRRITLFWGAVVQGLALILAGVFTKLTTDNPNKANAFGGAAVFFVFLYTAAFGATWLTVPWLYPTEIWPLPVRAKGNAWGVVGWSIGNGWCTLLVPVMFAKIHENALYVFGCANALSIVCIYVFYPETANRTLEEIDFLFASRSPFVWNAEKEYRRLKALVPEGAMVSGDAATLDALVEGKVDPEKMRTDVMSKQNSSGQTSTAHSTDLHSQK